MSQKVQKIQAEFIINGKKLSCDVIEKVKENEAEQLRSGKEAKMEIMMSEYFEALVEADDAPIVICDTEHVIIYMNPAAIKRYEKRGGEQLIGKSIFDCHNSHSKEIILSVIAGFLENPDQTKVYTYSKNWGGEDSDVYIVALRNKSGELIGYYEKHESRIHEGKCDFREKTEDSVRLV